MHSEAERKSRPAGNRPALGVLSFAVFHDRGSSNSEYYPGGDQWITDYSP